MRSLCVLCVIVAAASASLAQSPKRAPVPEAVYWPADSGYINVKEGIPVKGGAELKAAGDGKTDDTAALQAALQNHSAIYLPAGVYLVRDSLVAQPKRRFIQGDGIGKTIIKLADSSAGFADASKPKAVLANWSEAIGKGNNGQAFRNSMHDFTVEVGPGNPGAIGILYFTNNQGTIERVRVRSSDPGRSGHSGIALAQNWPGPALFRDVIIEGFDYGIWSIIGQYSFTLEHITLSDQRKAGIYNRGQKLFIRGLTSRQAGDCPAMEIDSGTIAIIDSTLAGKGKAAINAPKTAIYARNISTEGYSQAIIDKAGQKPGGQVAEHSGAGVTVLGGTRKESLNLPIEEAPYGETAEAADWVSVAKFGAKAGDGQDDTDAIQKAIDSGAKIVYFPRGSYDINGTVIIRGNVQLLHLMESGLSTGSPKMPGFDPKAWVFSVADGKASFVVIQQFEGSYGTVRPVFQHASTRPLVLRTLIPRGSDFYRSTVSGSRLFLDDVCADEVVLGNDQHCWARQYNPEPMGTHTSVDGGIFWCLGLKTEKAGKIVDLRGGGKAEIIGGYIYRNRGKQIPADYKGPGAGETFDAFYNDASFMSVAAISGDSSIQETTPGGQNKKNAAGGGLYVGAAK
jgi:hypothetical protein